MLSFLRLKFAWDGKYSCRSHTNICGSKSCFLLSCFNVKSNSDNNRWGNLQLEDWIGWISNITYLMLMLPEWLIGGQQQKDHFKISGIFEEDFIEDRRQGIEGFINKIAGHPLAQNEKCLHMFLTEPMIGEWHTSCESLVVFELHMPNQPLYSMYNLVIISDKNYVPGKVRTHWIFRSWPSWEHSTPLGERVCIVVERCGMLLCLHDGMSLRLWTVSGILSFKGVHKKFLRDSWRIYFAIRFLINLWRYIVYFVSYGSLDVVIMLRLSFFFLDFASMRWLLIALRHGFICWMLCKLLTCF